MSFPGNTSHTKRLLLSLVLVILRNEFRCSLPRLSRSGTVFVVLSQDSCAPQEKTSTFKTWRGNVIRNGYVSVAVRVNLNCLGFKISRNDFVSF